MFLSLNGKSIIAIFVPAPCFWPHPQSRWMKCTRNNCKAEHCMMALRESVVEGHHSQLHVLCHWALTTRQPPAPTIFYMYCKSGTECLSCTPSSHSEHAILTLSGIDQKIVSIREEPHAEWFSHSKYLELLACHEQVQHEVGFLQKIQWCLLWVHDQLLLVT